MPASFEKFVLAWLATVAIVRLKGTGYQEYESICRCHLVPAFGDAPIDGITVDRIQLYVSDKVAAGLAPRTAANHLQVLRLIFEYATTCGLVPENPVRGVVAPRQERSEMRYLTPVELHLLIESTSASWRLLIAMAALTGARKGEQLALLAHKDVDLDAGVIRISKSMRNGVVMSPKTSSSHGVVPLPPSLVPMIEERRLQVRDPNGLLFCRRDGSPLPDSLPNVLLARALTTAGLPRIRWHDLRHSWVVAHLQAGTDIPTLVRLGRWKSADVLLSTYAHVLPSAGGAAVRRLDESVSNR